MTFPVEFHIGPARISAHVLLETLRFSSPSGIFFSCANEKATGLKNPTASGSLLVQRLAHYLGPDYSAHWKAQQH
jgi:hypothetical protein